MKEKIKKAILFLLNPRLLICFGIAWMITNGWSYVALGIGSFYGIEWLTAIATAYLAFLWIPMTPEKILTVIVAIVLLRTIFPKDEKTLKILKGLHDKFLDKYKKDTARRRSRRAARGDKESKK